MSDHELGCYIADTKKEGLKMEWIDRDKRLPEIGDFCLVYMERRGSSQTNTVSTQFTKYGFERANVTHWMPLPEPPKAI
ncbi:MAG: DUF551 domain-containing protein [Colwellia sp.]|nr:DUF551 domain-containing protein [Colwellia sp.]